MTQPVLEIEDLHLSFPGYKADVHALNHVSLHINRGEIVGVVGESGSGKSVTAMLTMRLLPEGSYRIHQGRVSLLGEDVLNASEKQMRQWRGARVAMIFQEPMTALNPTRRIGQQMVEVIRHHQALSRTDARQKAVALLEEMQIPDAPEVMKRFPFELSGGMRQRVMIAMALLCRPRLLIADEPTTALDVTVQAQIMTLLNELKREFNTAIIMITHDLGVVAGICDKVLVMYAGRTMEYGQARDVFYQPSHPYSIGLLNAVPRLDAEGDALLTIPGNPPNLLRLPKGCPFQPRCPHAMEQCSSAPPLESFAPGRLRACFKPVGDLL